MEIQVKVKTNHIMPDTDEFAKTCTFPALLLVVQKSCKPVKVGSLYRIIYTVLYIPAGDAGFLKHQQYHVQLDFFCFFTGQTTCWKARRVEGDFELRRLGRMFSTIS